MPLSPSTQTTQHSMYQNHIYFKGTWFFSLLNISLNSDLWFQVDNTMIQNTLWIVSLQFFTWSTMASNTHWLSQIYWHHFKTTSASTEDTALTARDAMNTYIQWNPINPDIFTEQNCPDLLKSLAWNVFTIYTWKKVMHHKVAYFLKT